MKLKQGTSREEGEKRRHKRVIEIERRVNFLLIECHMKTRIVKDDFLQSLNPKFLVLIKCFLFSLLTWTFEEQLYRKQLESHFDVRDLSREDHKIGEDFEKVAP